ncbi:putative aspartate aminotransferase, cytoplasmic 2 [Carettochelys insculpta]|uniref:putative aspartate aminotransferase, cytoplasmic 2 n=1 Tax=Carettochelys insculpta TaxID=44489 RepID=UPI003EBF187E
MSSPLLLSSAGSEEEKPIAVLWGCELNTRTRRCVVVEDEDFLEHLVLLKTICLGEEAKDELHVVAVASKNTYGDNRPVPIASLRLSVLPMISLDGFELIPPVAFELKSGTGPVYLNGQHLILEDDAAYEARRGCLAEESSSSSAAVEEDTDTLAEAVQPPAAACVEGCQTETGKAWVCPAVKQSLLQITSDPTLDHEYLPVLGLSEFTRAATELVLGRGSRAILENRAGGVHTVGGTGAVRIGAEFLQGWYNRSSPGPTAVYIALPQWDSLQGIFQDAGFTEIRPYQYWDTVRLAVAIGKFLEALESAPDSSIVVLHAPEETGLTPMQWEEVARVMGRKHLFPFFNILAQGLASGDLDRDAWVLRHFVARGFELFCAQSFSKTFGLYGERVGNLIVVARDNETLVRICSQLHKQVMVTWATPNNLGARTIAMVLNNPALRSEWKQSLRMQVEKIMLIREKLKEKLRLLGTPGCWEHLTTQSGTRSFTGLLPSQVAFLAQHKHIYLLRNGQVSVCSLNPRNLDYVGQSINEAVSSTAQGVPGPSWAEMS